MKSLTVTSGTHAAGVLTGGSRPPVRTPAARHCPRGFATLTAILLMSIVAVAVLSLTSLTAAQAGRTRRDLAGGQMRQVLLAATTNISGPLSAGMEFIAGDEIMLALPPQLADVRVDTRIESADGAKLVARIRVRNEVMRLGQRVTFVKKDGTWMLSDVEGW